MVLSWCVLPSVSYSDNIMMTVARDKISTYMKALREGDFEGCYKVRQSIDKYEAGERKKIRKAMKKAFRSTHGNGDNILHLVVRLEQSDALKQVGDYRALVPDIRLAYDVLGPRLFLKLLNQKNDRGIAPAQEAASSEDLALEALQDFITKYDSSLRLGFFTHLLPVLGLLGASGLSFTESLEPLMNNAPLLNEFTMAGTGFFIGAAGLCYRGFKRAKDFNTANESLSLPERTYH